MLTVYTNFDSLYTYRKMCLQFIQILIVYTLTGRCADTLYMLILYTLTGRCVDRGRCVLYTW